MGSDAESLDLAGRLLGSALATSFELIPETSAPSADLASTDGANVAEVKRVTSPSLRELGHATADHDRITRDVSDLARRWSVILEAKTNSDSLPPMPKFGEPSTALREAWEADGFTVATRAEREAGFRTKHPGPPMSTVRVKGLIDALIPHFRVLETNGVSGNSYAWDHWFKSDVVSTTQRAILALTNGAHIHSFEPTEAPTGVEILLSWGYVRTEHADTIAGRIQTWLDSSLAGNLRDSLRPVEPGVRRHAVLVFDAASEPEFEVASTDSSFIPTTPLTLSPEVDRLWAVFGGRALSFDAAAGWSSHAIPPPPSQSRSGQAVFSKVRRRSR